MAEPGAVIIARIRSTVAGLGGWPCRSAIAAHSLNNERARSLAPAATTLSGSYVSIAQGDFISNPASHSLADTAYAYVPSACAAGDTCRVHVAFHGCDQEASGVVGSISW